MLTISMADLSPAERQNYLQYAIAPRPICFASTIDKDGNVNLSPFSFFNLFSSNPPICVFSPARRVRDNTTKHTLQNVLEVPECVINIVNYDMVQQTSLASTDYSKGINEFEKAGFTQLKSELVKPPRVKESPVQMECKIVEVISLGENGGAGNLILAEILLIHINENVLDENNKIDQLKMDHVARLGGDWYCRVTNDSLFKVAKPLATLGIGVDSLPMEIKNSKFLSGNNLGKLANVEQMPLFQKTENLEYSSLSNQELHLLAHKMLEEDKLEEAWQVLLFSVNKLT